MQRDKDGYVLPENASNEGLVWKERELIEKDASSYFASDNSKKVFVRSNFVPDADGGNVVALYENHAAHPSGEVYVAGSTPVEVALTERVAEALKDGQILVCSGKEIEAFEAERAGRVKRAVEQYAGEKETYRQKFVALFGTESGFEAAFEAILKQKGLQEIMTELRS